MGVDLNVRTFAFGAISMVSPTFVPKVLRLAIPAVAWAEVGCCGRSLPGEHVGHASELDLREAAAQIARVKGHVDGVECDPALNHRGNIRLERPHHQRHQPHHRQGNMFHSSLPAGRALGLTNQLV